MKNHILAYEREICHVNIDLSLNSGKEIRWTFLRFHVGVNWRNLIVALTLGIEKPYFSGRARDKEKLKKKFQQGNF